MGMTRRSVAWMLAGTGAVVALPQASSAQALPTNSQAVSQSEKISQVGNTKSEPAQGDGATGDSQQAADGGTAGDIIVTAQKRAERLQDVPMSVSAASGDQLKAAGVTSTEQLQRLVPGFTVDRTVFGSPVFFLRGVGFNDTAIGVSPAVSVYIDQLPIPFSAMARGAVLDLERVEVLKGPQGTLFGQNSTGGAVNFIAAKPTKNVEAGFDLTYGRFDQVDAEAFVSGPISNTLSARLAVREESRGPWQRGYTTDETLGRKDFQNGRLLVDWDPGTKLRVELSVTGWRDRSEAQQRQFVAFDPLVPAPFGYGPGYAPATFPVAPANARAAAWDVARDYRQDNSYYQFGGRIDFDLTSSIQITSLTSYSHYRQSVPTDFDATTYPLSFAVDLGNVRSFSQELRLSGSLGGGAFRWMIGGNYQRDRAIENNVEVPILNSASVGPPFGPFVLTGFVVDSDQRIGTKAVFGSLDVKLSDTLTAQGSARYTRQDRDFAGCLRDDGDGQVAGAFGFLSTLLTGRPQTIAPGACVTLSAAGTPLPIVTDQLNQNNLSWRAGLNWQPSRDTLLYANVTKGYKSGSFSTFPYVNATEAAGIPQESLLAYEVGTKLSVLRRAVEISAAGFYYDYRDKQLYGYINVPLLGGAFPGLESIPKSTVKGVEASVALRPIGGFTLSANGIYVDTRIDRDPAVPIGPFNNTSTFVGQPFPNSPKWQGQLDAQYRTRVSDSLAAYLGGAISVRSATTGTLVTGDPAVAAREALLRIPAYALVDLRAGIETSDGTIRLELWGRNVTNRFYLVSDTKAADAVTRVTGLPATYGLSLHYRYR